MVSENTLRRHLSAKGYRLMKNPARHWTRSEYGVGYQVVDDRNIIVAGCYQREFDASIEQVAEFAATA